MIQLKILSGKMAGNEKVARHFPFRIGRAPASDLQLEEDGVWDQHVELAFNPLQGFVVTAHPKALAAINGEIFQEAVLRNGDEMGIGAIKIRFWLSPTRQASLRIREWSTWTAFALIAAAQLALIYWLIP
ncbi:MAG: domain containing protein [Pedosphaera sp.]|nr:domain containing protein [Pedosphaera sp.]